MISYYDGLRFFVILILIGIGAVILGIREKALGRYGFGATAVVTFFAFWGKWTELLWLLVDLVWSLGWIAWYRRQRAKNGRVEKTYHTVLLLTLVPLIVCKTSGFYSPGLFGFTGISYLTFRAVQIVIELYDGVIRADAGTPEETLAFLMFFPSFSSGPIDRSRRFGEDYTKTRLREEYLDLCGRGLQVLLLGAVYKFVLAALAFKAMGYLDSEAAAVPQRIGYAYVYSLYLFFDFAGYSRMAVGTACILGVELPDNFRAPFISRDIKEFWDRWHISLSHWLRDFLFTRLIMLFTKRKLFGNRLYRACAGYLINMTVMGLWHGVSVSYLFYGIYHGLLLAGTEIYQKKAAFYKNNKTKPWYQVLSWFVTMQLVVFGFYLFSGKLLS